MTEKNSPQTEPIKDTTQADEKGGKPQADKAAPPSISESPDGENKEPQTAETESETDRKQDEAIDSIAEQTNWIARQTRWLIAQVVVSSVLTVLTLGVLIYHGIIMGRQSQAMKEQTDIMRGQLDSMNSSSNQTQQLIDATQRQANASQSTAEQNKELVAHAGEQAKASLTQAEAAKQSVGAAQTSARAAEQTARIAQESFYIGDRPYIAAGYLNIEEFEAGVKPRVGVVFSNTGKTPAIDVRAAAKVSIGVSPSPRPTTSEKYIAFEPTIATLPAGSIVTLPAGESMGVFVEGNEVLTNTTVEEIKNGKMFLFVFGLAFYKDGLGKPHELRFCQFYSPADDIFVACSEFNSTK